MGKSNLYSRQNISSLSTPAPSLQHLSNPPTGLAGFSPFLAEDNMIALSLWHELHLKHAMTSDVAFDFLGRLSLLDYIARRVRWIRVRKRMTPIIATVIEPFTESIVSGLCGSWAMHQLFRANGWGVFVVHMLIWVNVDLSVRRSLGWNRRIRGGKRGKVKGKGQGDRGTDVGDAGGVGLGAAGASGVSGEPGSADGVSTLIFLAAWMVREVLALPVYLYGILGDEVWWRGKRYRVIRSGEAVCVE
jgi:ceramide glucosyltransferase